MLLDLVMFAFRRICVYTACIISLRCSGFISAYILMYSSAITHMTSLNLSHVIDNQVLCFIDLNE